MDKDSSRKKNDPTGIINLEGDDPIAPKGDNPKNSTPQTDRLAKKRVEYDKIND